MPTSKQGHFYYSWFPTIYQAHTAHLSIAEDGAYRRLIDYYMTTKSPLPDNDAALARIVGVGRDEWDAVKQAVKTYFKPSTNPVGYLVHSFCEGELDLHDSRIEKARKNGKMGGRPKALEDKENKPVANLNLTQQKAEHNITEHNKRKKVSNNKDYNPIEREERASAPARKRIKDDWKLPVDWGEWAENETGLPKDKIIIEARKFHNNAMSKATASANWLAEWKKWIYRTKEIKNVR